MIEKSTAGPWKFERMEMFLQHARLTGQVLADHEGYFRENDGTWAIADSTGARVASATFRGTAKRGHGHETPDPEGQANARLIASAPDLLAALEYTKAQIPLPKSVLEKIEAALLKARGPRKGFVTLMEERGYET